MAAENAYKYDYGYAYAMPAQPLEKEKKQQKVRELPEISKVQQSEAAQSKKATLQVMKAAAVMAVVLMMFAAVCNSFIVKDRAKKRLDTANSQLVICQAENKELNAKLTALKSVENIDKFAVENLGLVKVTPENEIYLNSAKGNRVVLTQNEASGK
ncbi:MAG: hypothetical protein IKV21_03825 [Clostridia bacterium]|nr:hypothetical protein [Clostridia bacterium]